MQAAFQVERFMPQLPAIGRLDGLAAIIGRYTYALSQKRLIFNDFNQPLPEH